MALKLRAIFADFLKSARKMWLETMGGLFLAFAVMFALKTVDIYRRASGSFNTWDWQTKLTLCGLGFFSVVWLSCSLQSFWKARKIR